MIYLIVNLIYKKNVIIYIFNVTAGSPTITNTRKTLLIIAFLKYINSKHIKNRKCFYIICTSWV